MESHRNLVLLTILGLSFITADVDGLLNVYYVKADNNSICPHNPCKTLTEYTQNVSAYFTSDTQILFLPGLHTLKANTSIHIVNISQLSLIGDESLTAVTIPSNKCIIQCEGAAGFDFVNTSKLIIQSLTISNCGRPVEFKNPCMQLWHFILPSTSLSLQSQCKTAVATESMHQMHWAWCT